MHSLGAFVAPTWCIPGNPVRATYNAYVGLGDIVDGLYSLPANPVVAELKAKIAMAEALQKYPVGMSCGPSQCPCLVGLCGPVAGMGDITADVNRLLGQVTGSLGNWQTWAIVGAGVAALVMFTGGGGSQRRAEMTAARAQYKAKVAQIRASRPRRYQQFV